MAGMFQKPYKTFNKDQESRTKYIVCEREFITA